jgi:hypothetical protein
MDREKWDAQISGHLVETWYAVLSKEESDCVDQGNSSSVPAAAAKKLDDLIFAEAETLGWRIYLSEVVLRRLSEWEMMHDGPERLEKLGASTGIAAAIASGRRRSTRLIDPRLYQFRKETMQELRPLCRKIRTEFSTRRRDPRPEDLRKYVENTVNTDASSFPHLKANLKPLLDYLDENQDIRSQLFVGRSVKVAELFDSWTAWRVGYQSAETIRQQISKLPGQVVRHRPHEKL